MTSPLVTTETGVDLVTVPVSLPEPQPDFTACHSSVYHGIILMFPARQTLFYAFIPEIFTEKLQFAATVLGMTATVVTETDAFLYM